MIDPKKLIDRDVGVVEERMQHHELKYRIVRENGLITVDYDAERYTLIINENNIIIDAYYG